MLKKNRMIAIGMVWLMIVSAFSIMSGSVAATDNGRAESFPSWDMGNYWIYRFDDTTLDMYSFVTTTYTDPNNVQIKTECQQTPTSDSNQDKRTITQIDTGAGKIKMSRDINAWENGTWANIVTDNGGSTYANNGDTMDSGTYTRTTTYSNSYSWYDMTSHSFLSGYIKLHDVTDYTSTNGDWSLTIDEDVTDSTSSGPEQEMKPTWSTEPLDVGDQWTQKNTYTRIISESYLFGGTGSGSGTYDITRNYYNDYTWQVASKSQKTINNVMGGGTNNYPEAYKLTRTGSFDWDADDGTNSNSGTVTPGPYEYWVAGDGDPYDAGWAIEFNGTTRLIYSDYVAFINSPPEIDTAPPTEVDINEDELWEFGNNGVDFLVTDPDSGVAGDLSYTVAATLNGNPALTDLTIDSNGDIAYTPDQLVVADGYDVTITVTDLYAKDPLSVDVNFILNIKNTNDAPVADSMVMEDFTMDEGATYTPSWRLSDVFSDIDMDYDPQEKLTYSVSNNGSVRVLCNSNDIGPTNQCDAVTFEAIDGQFARDLPVAITITATDKGGLKAPDQVTVTVKHVNHAPMVRTDAIDEFPMDEDTIDQISLKEIFTDIDIGNPNYPTSDTLTYDKDGEKNMKITITGTKAKIEPDDNWNGDESITFEAQDKSGAKADHKVKVIVRPINDDPVVDSIDPTTDPSIDETDDGTETGDLTEQVFSIVASDIDTTTGQNDVLTYNWTVEDGDTLDTYDISTHDASYTMKTAFDGDFTDGNFNGGESSKTYIVTCVVSDGTVDVEAKKWFVTVRNVNRKPVVSDVGISELKKSGELVPVIAKSLGNYSLKYGKVYTFDVTNFVTDLDEGIVDGTGTENLDMLQFDWSSSIDGSIGSTASINVGAGKGSALADFKLKEGKAHVITLIVTDNDGGSTEYVFTVKVSSNSVNPPGFEALLFVAAVGVAVALLAYRRR